MQTKEILRTVFNNEELVTFEHDGKEVWLAAQISKILGYSRYNAISKLIREKWKDEFVLAENFFLVAGDDLVDLRRLSPPGGLSRARHALLLTESGVNRVLMLTKKKVGIQLRDHLDTVVLPQFRRGMIEEKDVEELKARQREEVAALKDKLISRDELLLARDEELLQKGREVESLQREQLQFYKARGSMRDQASAFGKGLSACRGTKILRN